MDGLLIDTEPAWRAAESAVLAGLGISLSDSDLLDSTGQPIEALIPVWRRRQPPDSDRRPELTDAEVADRITDQVIAHVMAEGQPMPGVTAAIALFERYGLPLAIASSSPLRLIDAVCVRLGLAGIHVRCSGADEALGKPAPDVYLTAARRLGVAAASCLAMEDSPHGIASAKSAGMRCVAVPDPLLAADPRYREADLVIPSLTALDNTALQLLGVRASQLATRRRRPSSAGNSPHFGTSPISAAILTGVLALSAGSTRMAARKAESNVDRRTKPTGYIRGLGVAAGGGTG